MVDKIFNKMFTAMDQSTAVQKVSTIMGLPVEHQPQGIFASRGKLKKSFFCEQCCFELCVSCKERHEQGHPVKFIEEAATFVMDKFRGSLEEIKALRHKVLEAANEDPCTFPPIEGVIDVLETGDREIEHIFDKIHKSLEAAKQEMKERLKEAYRATYKSIIDTKSQNFFTQLEKLEGYVNTCLQDFQRKMQKDKAVIVCLQREKVDELYLNIDKFEGAFRKMQERAREFRQDFSITYKHQDFDNNLKNLLNHHCHVSFPGMDSGFFPGVKKTLSLKKQPTSEKSDTEQPKFRQKQPQPDFDPLKSLEKEEYDIRRARELPVITPIQEQKALLVDTKYELRALKFRQNKFELKSYDASNKKSSLIEIQMPEEVKRIATRYFSYTFLNSKEVLLCGGQYVEDKTCSMDSYMIDSDEQTLEDLKTYMKQPRMHHSMLYLSERQQVLAVGGEDENGHLHDSCEIFTLKDKAWKVMNTLNYKGKHIGLCKFTRESKKSQLFVFAFGKNSIERIDLSKSTVDPKWEELNIKNHLTLNMAPLTLQFDDNMILICGGADDKNIGQQDIVYFNPNILKMEKATSTQLSICDKFLGGAMTQYVINRMECKIFFCSEAFVHELEYGAKAGEAKYKCKANLF